jgi:dTDP-L-rhamnose 4-epimerase
MNVLITGGAGFIGTHLSRRLLREGCTVTILDNFLPQVHGASGALPADLRGEVELVTGDVRDGALLERALAGKEAVVHLAAETGTGQSMYEVVRYESVNIGGTASLLERLVNVPGSGVARVVVASSRAIYGEGKYRCAGHGTVFPEGRTTQDMKAGIFEPRCPHCGTIADMLPTDETAVLHPSSLYGLTKQVQEQMTLMYARTLGISGYALRYQNVYGPGQSLSNPYTGILAIFSSQARRNLPINIFEDGRESRDFVYIDDVVEATWRCIAREQQEVEAYNVGSGAATTVLELAREIVAFFGSSSETVVSGDFRSGDIRHNLADLTKVRQALGYEPQWRMKAGLAEFLRWAGEEEPAALRYRESLEEMKKIGLYHSSRRA